MKRQAKLTIAALASATILLGGSLCQTSQAVLLNESGTSVLADVLGANTGNEALTVDWSVVENASLIYTYTYTIYNPSGDVQLPGSASPGSPEVVDAFTVGFDTTVPGAFLSGTQTGGVLDQNNGVGGLTWIMSAVPAGGNSGPLSFESLLLPTMGDANAADANPPSPWASNPDGQEVPIPGATAVPDSMNTMAALAGALLLLPALRRTRVLPVCIDSSRS
jgi:hypothetical protein